MPKKTKKEKILAERRRKEHMVSVNASPVYSLDIKSEKRTLSETPSIQSVTVMTGHADLKKDLIKISVFTFTAIALQFFLYFFVIK